MCKDAPCGWTAVSARTSVLSVPRLAASSTRSCELLDRENDEWATNTVQVITTFFPYRTHSRKNSTHNPRFSENLSSAFRMREYCFGLTDSSSADELSRTLLRVRCAIFPALDSDDTMGTRS